MEIIRVNNFKKSYEKNEVHKDVSFTVLKGECLGLIGGSGAGKSVLLRSLIGLERPDEGSVLIEGKDIIDFSENDLVPIRKKISYVFQGGALFDSMSIFDNIAYPLREHTNFTEEEIRVEVAKLVEDFGLKGSENLFPAEVSGGMQKRVGLARAIALNPEVILYDEPTAGLDPMNTIKIQNLIIKLKSKGVTSILVTHDMPTALRVCDRICLLEKGLVIASIPTNELIEKGHHLITRFMNGEIQS